MHENLELYAQQIATASVVPAITLIRWVVFHAWDVKKFPLASLDISSSTTSCLGYPTWRNSHSKLGISMIVR